LLYIRVFWLKRTLIQQNPQHNIAHLPVSANLIIHTNIYQVQELKCKIMLCFTFLTYWLQSLAKCSHTMKKLAFHRKGMV